MNIYQTQWNEILKKEGTQNVDVITSIKENGINHFLEKHHQFDSLSYKKTFEKAFDSHNTKRKFKVEISLNKPVEIQFPPFTSVKHNESYRLKKDWFELEAKHNSPELKAPSKEADPNIRINAKEIVIKIEWDKLNTTGKWSITLNPFEVLAESYIKLNQDADGYFLTIVPTLLKFDIPRNEVQSKIKNLSNSEALVGECEEKITDLFIIAANIAATEQTPKLVRNIQIPAPVIADKPLNPALLDISNNILTIGFGLDKQQLRIDNQKYITKSFYDLKSNINKDIEENGGLEKMVSTNYSQNRSIEDIEFLEEEEILEKFKNTNILITKLENQVTSNFTDETQELLELDKSIKDAYAFGINEYFFDTIVDTTIPEPQSDCTKWLNIKLAKGRICHWSKFTNSDIKISNTAVLSGGVNVDVGGAIEACIKKAYDCSWEWICSKLSMSIKGRPKINLKLKKSRGVSLLAQLDGRLYLDVNLPWPFNKIVKGLTGLVWTFLKGFINILLALLSFVVIKPVFSIPNQKTKLRLLDFDSFYYERPQIKGNFPAKNKFIGYKGGLLAIK
ncbi:hypothetical protein CLV91_3395 [Maribacter vaceletii]|uniref:Uncharacterized protein n=1 Tax=Maribacter vaceletii TaxID=1206816 RepID=A0A495DRN7_9FLAO|nr:hypothetical protein [Maribacter vaceletii]RKR06435.1 hypothetical protein CLV91_3395 [Maribacter vaceletii]